MARKDSTRKDNKRKQPPKSQDKAEDEAKAKAARREEEAKQNALVDQFNAAIHGGTALPVQPEPEPEPAPASPTSTGAPPVATEGAASTTEAPAQPDSGTALDVEMTDVTKSPAQAEPEAEPEATKSPAQAVADNTSVASVAAGSSNLGAASVPASPALKVDKAAERREKKLAEMKAKLEEDIATVKKAEAQNPDFAKEAEVAIDKLVQQYKDDLKKEQKNHDEAKEKAAQERMAQGAYEFFTHLVSGCVDRADLKSTLASLADDVMGYDGETSKDKFFACLATNVAEIYAAKDAQKEAEAARLKEERTKTKQAKLDAKAAGGTPKDPSVSDEERERIKQAREALVRKMKLFKGLGTKEYKLLKDVLGLVDMKNHILATLSGDANANIKKKKQSSTATHGNFVEKVWNKVMQEFEANNNHRNLLLKNAKIAEPTTADFFTDGICDCAETRALGVPSLESCLRDALESCLRDALPSCAMGIAPLKLAGMIKAEKERKAEKDRKAAEKKAEKAADAAAADPPDGVVVETEPVVILSDDEGDKDDKDKERETAEPHTAEVRAQAASTNGKAPMAAVAMERDPIDDEPMAMAQ